VTSNVLSEKIKENDVWNVILTDNIDEVISKTKTDEVKNLILGFQNDLLEALNKKSIELDGLFEKIYKDYPQKKDFYKHLNELEISKIDKQILNKMFPSNDSMEQMKNYIETKIRSKIDDEIRDWLYNIKLFKENSYNTKF
jgi:hypothetical protein